MALVIGVVVEDIGAVVKELPEVVVEFVIGPAGVRWNSPKALTGF